MANGTLTGLIGESGVVTATSDDPNFAAKAVKISGVRSVVHDTKATQELLVALNKVTSYATKHGVTLITSAGNDANNGNTD